MNLQAIKMTPYKFEQDGALQSGQYILEYFVEGEREGAHVYYEDHQFKELTTIFLNEDAECCINSTFGMDIGDVIAYAKVRFENA